MAKVSSLSAPGVEVREYDNSLRITNNTGTTVFVPGYAAQGPVEEIIPISSITDFESVYGIPTNAAERYFYYTCLAILNNSGAGSTLLTSRIPYGSGDGDMVASAYSMLVYPAIPVTRKTGEDVKSYTYYAPNAPTGDGPSIEKFFTLSGKTATIDRCEVIINSAKEGKGTASGFSITDITPGTIPGLKCTNTELTSATGYTPTTIKWSFNGTVPANGSPVDIYSEKDEDGKIHLHITAQLTNGDDIFGCLIIDLHYEDTASAFVGLFSSTTLAATFEDITQTVDFTKKTPTAVADSLDKDNDMTYVIGAPALFNVSLSEYYQIISKELFQWKNTLDTFAKKTADVTYTFGDKMKEALQSAAFIAINTSRTIITDTFEGFYLGLTDNLFNEPTDEYILNAVNSVKFTSKVRENTNDVSGVVDAKSGNEFTTVNTSRLNFYLDSSNKGSISDVLQTSASSFDTSAKDYDDTINLALFKLSKSPNNNETMTLGYSVVEKYNASLGRSREYSTSDSLSVQNYFIENILGDSKNIMVMVNPAIADKIKIDPDGTLRGKVRFLCKKNLDNYKRYEDEYLSSSVTTTSDNLSVRVNLAKNNIENWATLCSRVGVSIEDMYDFATDETNYDTFNVCNSLYPFATYTVLEKDNKYIGSTPNKIRRILDLISNDEEYPDIDIILEGGLGTVYSYSNNAKALISDGPGAVIQLENGGHTYSDGKENENIFDDTKILQGIEDLRTTRSTLTAEADRVLGDYMDVQNAFLSLANSFQNGGRGDTFYIADILRGIVLRGQDTKVEKLFGTPLTNNVYSNVTNKVNHSWATSIYNPIKHSVDGLTSSYASIYAQWLKVNDSFTHQRCWVPASGYMGALMCASDQLQGPWYAAAGLNRGIVNGVIDCAINPNQKQRGDLYKICVNSVPKISNVGITCWGIRTLSKKASAFDQNTCRRTFLFIEKAVKKLLRYYLFEPNNSYTQLSIYNEIEPYMESIRNQGGIYSYQIVCDASNNTPDIVNSGNLAVDISAAPTRTAEFIVLNMTANKYTQSVATSEFVG